MEFLQLQTLIIKDNIVVFYLKVRSLMLKLSNCCYASCATLIVRVGGMPWRNSLPYTSRLPDKVRAIKELVV